MKIATLLESGIQISDPLDSEQATTKNRKKKSQYWNSLLPPRGCSLYLQGVPWLGNCRISRQQVPTR